MGDTIVTRRNPVWYFVPIVLFATASVFPAGAADVEKKFRIGATVGFFNAQDEVKSDAGNTLILGNRDLLFEDIFIDPRNDSAVFGKLDLNPAFSGTIYAQYAVTKIFLVEASVGYAQQDMGDVELQVQFDQNPIPVFQPFLFNIYRIQVGEVERIPVQFTALARLRPRASFNPYIGLGVGYTYNGFTPTDEFNALSIQLDKSRGGFAPVSSSARGNPTFGFPGSFDDLLGATVEVEDTFEWHTAFGFELSFKRKWALMVDARWTLSSRSAHVGFNGGTDLGVAVPERVDFIDNPLGSQQFGGIRITGEGGLVDGGSLVPAPSTNPTYDCLPGGDPMCVFDPTQPDGIVDPGIYYIQGGEFDYGGIGVEIGLRYTF